MYQTVKRENAVPVSALGPVKDSYSAATINSGAALDAKSMGSALDEQMQAKMQTMLSRQIPEAEQEADRIAHSVSDARTPEDVKSQLGETMGADFSGVRFHTGTDAAAKAESIGARAYATGNDIYFGEGGFDPQVAAHELVHTAQQGVVDSAVATSAAPMGGIQMMPKWLTSIKNGISSAWGGVKKFFGFGGGRQQQQQPAATVAAPLAQPAPQPMPIGTSMSPLGAGAYDPADMSSKISTLLPIASQHIADKTSGNIGPTDGGRYDILRNDSTGNTPQEKQARKDYVMMMKKAGRSVSKEMLPKMAEGLDTLPEAPDFGGYKSFRDEDWGQSEMLRSYQDKALGMTGKYLGLMEQNPEAMDALKQSASGLYGGLGEYDADTNRGGLVGGKLEASHRAMNDMLLRSFGPDTLMGIKDLGKSEGDSKKMSIVSQAMAAMQPNVLAAVVEPEKMASLSPHEQSMATMYYFFFKRNGMLD